MRRENTHYRPMDPFEAAQRRRPLAERATHADDNSRFEALRVGREIIKHYDGNDPKRKRLRARAWRDPSWRPSWKLTMKLLGEAKKAARRAELRRAY